MWRPLASPKAAARSPAKPSPWPRYPAGPRPEPPRCGDARQDEVNVPDLDQFYRRQGFPLSPRCGDVQPAFLVAVLEGVEIAVKVIAATVTPPDLTNRYGPYPHIVVSVDGAGGLDLIETEQAAWTPDQG